MELQTNRKTVHRLQAHSAVLLSMRPFFYPVCEHEHENAHQKQNSSHFSMNTYIFCYFLFKKKNIVFIFMNKRTK